MNRIFLSTPPVEAHRNRIKYLLDKLIEESFRGVRRKKPIRILNLGCGPAFEIQEFLTQGSICEHAAFTLWDFNDETLQYVSQTLEKIKSKWDRRTLVQVQKKSVQQLLKESSKFITGRDDAQYDFIYCAGLFDYLSDPVCKRLMNVFYDLLAPGGLLAATNVTDSNPSRNWMEYILDWHLIYRNEQQFATLVPDAAQSDLVTTRAVGTGVNIFLEVRKPQNA